jgi:hypothetical protein
MPDSIPFASAKLKIERANQHIKDVERWVRYFLDFSTYSLGINADDKVFITRPPPIARTQVLAAIVGDAVHNLRVALDHIAFEILQRFGGHLETTGFPIEKDRQSLLAQPRYQEIERVAPDIANIIADFVDSNGHQLFGLNHLDFIDKHTLLLTPVSVARVSVLCIDDENKVPSDLPLEITLLVLPKGAPLTPGSAADLHNRRNSNAFVEVCFGKGEPFENEPIIPTLHQLSELVSSIRQTLEAHFQRGNP